MPQTCGTQLSKGKTEVRKLPLYVSFPAAPYVVAGQGLCCEWVLAPPLASGCHLQWTISGPTLPSPTAAYLSAQEILHCLSSRDSSILTFLLSAYTVTGFSSGDVGWWVQYGWQDTIQAARRQVHKRSTISPLVHPETSMATNGEYTIDWISYFWGYLQLFSILVSLWWGG